jgi:hypothetical protein
MPNRQLRTRKRVIRLLFHKFRDESKGCTDIVQAEVVLSLDVFKRHPAGQASNDDGYRNARARVSPVYRNKSSAR